MPGTEALMREILSGEAVQGWRGTRTRGSLNVL